MITKEEILDAFWKAEDEFGEHKSTEFLASILAERLDIEYMDVMTRLAAYAEENCQDD